LATDLAEINARIEWTQEVLAVEGDALTTRLGTPIINFKIKGLRAKADANPCLFLVRNFRDCSAITLENYCAPSARSATLALWTSRLSATAMMTDSKGQ
jgi:hypothetical protein